MQHLDSQVRGLFCAIRVNLDPISTGVRSLEQFDKSNPIPDTWIKGRKLRWEYQITSQTHGLRYGQREKAELGFTFRTHTTPPVEFVAWRNLLKSQDEFGGANSGLRGPRARGLRSPSRQPTLNLSNSGMAFSARFGSRQSVFESVLYA